MWVNLIWGDLKQSADTLVDGWLHGQWTVFFIHWVPDNPFILDDSFIHFTFWEKASTFKKFKSAQVILLADKWDVRDSL